MLVQLKSLPGIYILTYFWLQSLCVSPDKHLNTVKL